MGTRKFLASVVIIQLMMWILISLDSPAVAVARQIVGFIYLSFVPGAVILKTLRLWKLDFLEAVLFSVGLSLALSMFLGLFMAIVYPLLGVSTPFSTESLVTTFGVVVFALCFLCFKRNRGLCDEVRVSKNQKSPSISVASLAPPLLLFCLLILLSTVGAYMVNFLNTNVLLMCLIIAIALIIVLAGSTKLIPESLYPLLVFTVSLALLYHRSLISTYLWGWDIHFEYYTSNLVASNLRWDPMMPLNFNSVLSTVLLAPIFQKICGADLVWIFKIFYPLLYSFVPLALFRMFQRQIDTRSALLSCFFFMSLFTYYSEMLTLARQQIAELFLVLVMLLIIDAHMDRKKMVLSMVFMSSLIVSHYGVAFVFVLSSLVVWVLFSLGKRSLIRSLIVTFREKSGKLVGGVAQALGRQIDSKSDRQTDIQIGRSIKVSLITSTFICLWIIFAVTWYTVVANSSVLDTLVGLGNRIVGAIFGGRFRPETVEGLAILTMDITKPLHQVSRILHLVPQFLIVVGVLALLSRQKGRFRREFIGFSVFFLAMLVAGLTVPYFASSLDTQRIYHLALIFLAPFFVTGAISICSVLFTIVRKSWTNRSTANLMKFLSIFVAIFLLFNAGFVYEIANEGPNSISISQESIRTYGSVGEKVAFYNTYIPREDAMSATWLAENRHPGRMIFSDQGVTSQKSSVLLSVGMIADEEVFVVRNGTKNIPANSYLYLRFLNVREGLMLYRPAIGKTAIVYNTTEISSLIGTLNRIYSNGGSDIYFQPSG